MLLIETPVDRITDILTGTRPVAFVPAASRDRALEIAATARDDGFGFAVVEVRSKGLVVLVVAEPEDEGRLRRNAEKWGDEGGIEIAPDQNREGLRVGGMVYRAGAFARCGCRAHVVAALIQTT